MKYIRLFTWITGILLAIIAPVQLYRTQKAFGQLQLVEIIIYVLPPILFIGTARILNRTPKNKSIHGYGFIYLIGVLLCYFFLFLGLEMFINSRPVTDISQYKRILNQWKKSAPEIVSHFPDPIPSDAQGVNFYFSPSFLQADNIIQLNFKTTQKKIFEYYTEYSKITTKSYRGIPVYYLSYKNKEEIEEIFDHRNDFETLEFDKDPNNIPEHGKRHGVIINRKENIIIFWADW